MNRYFVCGIDNSGQISFSKIGTNKIIPVVPFQQAASGYKTSQFRNIVHSLVFSRLESLPHVASM